MKVIVIGFLQYLHRVFMDELYTRYKQIKVIDPSLPSFADWKLEIGLREYEKARFENKRTKKNVGGYVNKPMNVGRRSNSPIPPRNIKREEFLFEMAEKKEARKRKLIEKATETARANLDKQIKIIEANALKY